MIQTSHIDLVTVREQFPVLNQKVNGKPLIYFDNAATTQKPISVINSIVHYYQNDNANIHRGIHTLAERATSAFEDTRKEIAKFLNANEPQEIVFTRGTTEAINLVASTLSESISEGDELIISTLEHHSNFVPWQQLAIKKGATLKVIPLTDDEQLDLSKFSEMLSPKTKLVAVNHISNSLGLVNPIEEIIRLTRETNALILIDGAQATSHMSIDVQKLDCDFYAISAHKMYGPTGIGAL